MKEEMIIIIMFCIIPLALLLANGDAADFDYQNPITQSITSRDIVEVSITNETIRLTVADKDASGNIVKEKTIYLRDGAFQTFRSNNLTTLRDLKRALMNYLKAADGLTGTVN